MNSTCAWNVRAANKVHKQIDLANFIRYNNISLIGILESKVKRAGLWALYLRVFPNWCITSNLDWHKGGRIVVAWRSED